jgi:putative restriction endonuclease
MLNDSVQLRLSAFVFLDRLLDHGPYVTRQQLRDFTFGDETFPLVSGSSRGIYKPAGWNTVVSIMSSDTPSSAGGYDDEYQPDGTLLYKFMNPAARNSRPYNSALLETARQQLPLVLLEKVAPKLFEPIYPVWIGAQIDDSVIVSGVLPNCDSSETADFASELRKRYAVVRGKRRLHQEIFRSQVLFAYGNRCAICKLGRRGLLDASHIIDYSED